MIHPINIPEEIFSANPRRPSLLQTPVRPKLSYAQDGRQMLDNHVMNPLSPSTMWKETFLRTFVRSIMVTKADSIKEEEKCMSLSKTLSAKTKDRIDIIDLEPCSTNSSPEYVPNDKEESDKARVETPQAVISNEITNEEINPHLQACCPSLCDYSGDKMYCEFLRLDFSKFGYEEEEQRKVRTSSPPPEVMQNRKRSVNFVPNRIANQVWVNLKDSMNKFDSACSAETGTCETANQLKFAVDQVKISKNILHLKLQVFNENNINIQFKSLLHCHVYENGVDLGMSEPAVESQNFLQAMDEAYIIFNIPLSNTTKRSMEHPAQALIVTLMARLEEI
uniref:RanBD1 domain-containing protein n=1 Tax=Rhabditophanes sp. KR3021 TaxID=114890 RepID=A0AC35TYV6_9BILA